MVSNGRKSYDAIDIHNIKEADIAAYYLGINNIPCLICSPLRPDKNPSFSIYSPNGTEVNYKDFSTQESGSIWTLLKKLWNYTTYNEVRERVYKDLGEKTIENNTCIKSAHRINIHKNSSIDLQCKVRHWKKHDLEYWESYGITKEWLQYADVYPISYKIIIKDNIQYTYKADKYAYAYVEFKDNRTTLKIYQPFNTKGYKWSNCHDGSVLSLWTKVPKKGNILCICSSLKDALCLWANAGIPSIAVQGEGYNISNTAINELKKRFNKIYICFDNDKAGLIDGEKLSKTTGFINIVLPKFPEGKDISDLRKAIGKDKFINIIKNLFNG